MKMIPGMNKIDDGMLKQGEQQLKKIEAMIGSMTEQERERSRPAGGSIPPGGAGLPAAVATACGCGQGAGRTSRRCAASCSR